MAENSTQRVQIQVPFSTLEIVDRIVKQRRDDGEIGVNRTSVSLELLKLGARIEKKKMENVESGANPFDSRTEEQLAYIGRKIANMDLRLSRFIKMMTMSEKIDKEIMNTVLDGLNLSENERVVLKRLFIEVKSLSALNEM